MRNKEAALEKLDTLKDRQEINAAAATRTVSEREEWINDCKEFLTRYAEPELLEMEKELKKRKIEASYKFNEEVPIHTLKFSESSIGACELNVDIDRQGDYRVQIQGLRDAQIVIQQWISDVSGHGAELKESLWGAFNRLV